jgi:glucose-1-phosphate thymidylyltransferase
MKGIILAGGTGQRLHPLTRVTNKHLLPVYDRPMIYHAIEQLVTAGLSEIMIVTGGNHAGEFLRLLAEALGLTEYFAEEGPLAVLLGDNIFEFSLAASIRNFGQEPEGAMVLLSEVEDPSAYGVAELRDGRIVRIIEKPAVPPSRFAVTGLYLYDHRVFEIVRGLRPSGRGELEITDVNNAYLERGVLRHEIVHGYWADCGESIEGLMNASALVAKRGANKPLD